MLVDYIYCPYCGYEAIDEYVAYSRTTASCELYLCPTCGEETSVVEIEN